jgi:hypothetical protein
MKDEFVLAHDQGVSGIISPLKTNDHVGVLGQEVNYLPFPFIAPLGAYNHDARHIFAPLWLFRTIGVFMPLDEKSQPICRVRFQRLSQGMKIRMLNIEHRIWNYEVIFPFLRHSAFVISYSTFSRQE